MNRLQQVSYDVTGTNVPATPTVSYTYGTNSTANENGRLKTVTDGIGSETYTYDVLVQILSVSKVISGTTYATNYQYNAAGALTTMTYQSGRVVNQQFDSIGRLIQLYGPVAGDYLKNFQYNVAGQVTQFKYGNNVTADFTFTPERLQMQSLKYTQSGQTNPFLSLTYCYRANCDTGTGGNNGQITRITDNVDSGRTVNYTYDALNRLVSALTNGSAAYPRWGLSWTYDRYGNRSQQTVAAGTGPSNSLGIDPATNRISGYCYDANGNLLAESAPPCPAQTYAYDAEGLLTAYGSSSGSYAAVYDGSGLRVKKCSPNCTNPTTQTVYVFNGSQVIAEYENGGTSPVREYVYSGTGLVATHEAGTVSYHHNDHLSRRVATNSSGIVAGQSGHYPYGENWYESGATSKLKFASYVRESESNLDHTWFRKHSPTQGRWLSPDPMAGHTRNPQTMNRYNYSINNPVNMSDPLGLDPCWYNRFTCEPPPMEAPMPSGFGTHGFNQFDALRASSCGPLVSCGLGFGWEGLWFDSQTGEWGYDSSAFGIFHRYVVEGTGQGTHYFFSWTAAASTANYYIQAYANGGYRSPQEAAIAGLDENGRKAIS